MELTIKPWDDWEVETPKPKDDTETRSKPWEDWEVQTPKPIDIQDFPRSKNPQAKPWDDWEVDPPKPFGHLIASTARSSSTNELSGPFSISQENSKSAKEPSIKSSNSKIAVSVDSSPSEQIAKLLDSGKISTLRDLADKYIMVHYIDFYQRQSVILDLAQNYVNPMLVNLIKQKLCELQKDYLLDSSPLKLMLISQPVRNNVNNAISNFRVSVVKDAVHLQFLEPVVEEVLSILSKSLLPKFKQLKLKEQPKSDKGKITEENTIPALVKVLDSEIECDKMIEILAKQHCMENLFYYQKQKEIYAYAATATSPIEKQTLKKMIKDVAKEFIVSSAPCELNIPSKLRSDFEEASRDANISLVCLDPITKEVLNMMLRNTFPIYLKNNK